MKSLFTRFIRHQNGVALIEFAIVFPIMFLLLFGGIELSRYILIIQRVEHAAYVLTDITGQYSPATSPDQPATANQISVAELTNNVFPQFHRIMGRYGDTSREVVVISSVVKQGGVVKLRWQRTLNGGGVPGVTSVVTGTAPANTTRTIAGSACANAPFNAEINTQLTTMMNTENMLVGEVFFRYQPIVASLLGVTGATPKFTGPFSVPEQTISRRLFLHPRLGDLVDLPPAHPVSAGACP